MSDSPRVLVVTVHYGHIRPTRVLLESLAALDGFDQCRVVVVDNGGPDGVVKSPELAHLAAEYAPRLSVLVAGENLFYWPAAASALRALYPRVTDLPNWTIVCNNDVVIPDATFLEKLFRLDGTRYHVIAPSIRTRETGRDQNPFLRRPLTRIEWLKWRVYFLGYPVARMLLLVRSLREWFRGRGRKRIGKEDRSGEPERIYAPHGAFVIFAKEFFARGGRLDTSFSMYGEEMTIARDAGRLGLDVYYIPSLEVVHEEHATAGSTLTPEKYRLEREAHRGLRSEL